MDALFVASLLNSAHFGSVICYRNMDKIYETICEAIRSEEDVLRKIGRGAFLMQEIAMVYIVSRAFIRNSELVFGVSEFELRTETSVDGRKGRADLYIELAVRKIVFEFKTRSNLASCKADIQKLRAVSKGYDRYFCALIETKKANPKDHEIIDDLSKEEDLISIRSSNLYYFDTQDYQKVKDSKMTCCLVGLWKIRGADNKASKKADGGTAA